MKMHRLFTALFCFLQGAMASELPGEKIKVSFEFAAACSVLSANYVREFTTLPSYTKKDVSHLNRLIGCTSSDGFTLEMSHLKQHRHARALIAAVHLGLQPRVNQQSEVIVDRLSLLRTTLWNRLLDDKEVDGKISKVIENDPTLKAECIDQLVKRMSWRALCLSREVRSRRANVHFQLAAGAYKCSSQAQECRQNGVLAACLTRYMDPYLSGPLLSDLCAFSSEKLRAGEMSYLEKVDAEVRNLISSPSGNFIAYVKEGSRGTVEVRSQRVQPRDQFGEELAERFLRRIKLGEDLVVTPSEAGISYCTSVTNLQFFGDDCLLITYNDRLEEWDIKKEERIRCVKLPKPVGKLVVSPNGQELAFAYDYPNGNTYASSIYRCKRTTGEVVEIIDEWKKVNALGYTKDNVLRIVASKDLSSKAVSYVWDVAQKKILSEVGVFNFVSDPWVFDACAERVLFSDFYNFEPRLRMLDVETGRLVIDCKGSSRIFSGSFSADSSRVATLQTGFNAGAKTVSNVPLAEGPYGAYKSLSERQRDEAEWSEVTMWLNGAEQLKEAGHTLPLADLSSLQVQDDISICQLIEFARTGSYSTHSTLWW